MINCMQLNLHKSIETTTNIGYNIEQSDDPIIALVQEPYCIKGIPKYTPGNCNIYYDTKADNPRALVYISNSISNNFFYQSGFSCKDMVTISTKLTNHTLYITNCYMDITTSCPPPLLTKLLDHCKTNNHRILVSADTNAHHTAWGNKYTNARGTNLLNLISAYDLEWANDTSKHTWKRNAQSSIIDLTLTSPNATKLTNWTTVPHFTTSDHELITFGLELNDKKFKYKNLTIFKNRSKCNWELFKQKIKKKLNDNPIIPTTATINNTQK